MLMTLSEILRSRATTGDSSVPLTEVFFDPADGRLAYLALDTGGWFERSEVIVSADRMGVPDADRRLWPADISRKALEDAPEWSGDPDRVSPLIEALPPIVIGPFGNTFSPLMMYAMMASDGDDTETPRSEGDARVFHFERASHWRGRPAFGTDGELGTLSDLVFDLPARRLSHFVIGGGDGLFSRDRTVPFARLRHWAEGSTHVVLNIARAEFEAIEPGTPGP